MADENYSFQTRPPERVRRYLADKGNRVSFSFEDVEPEEHAVAFTVAKAASVEVLGAIREEVQKALDEGRTLDRFKRDLEPRLRAFGWWGKQRMVDPETGEERLVTLGSPRRLRTIYRSNMRA
ncbi:MAG: head morphogenesis protein, partial [Pseudomonadota bacterium]